MHSGGGEVARVRNVNSFYWGHAGFHAKMFVMSDPLPNGGSLGVFVDPLGRLRGA